MHEGPGCNSESSIEEEHPIQFHPIPRSKPITIASLSPSQREERRRIAENDLIFAEKCRRIEADRLAQDAQRKTYVLGRLGHEPKDLPNPDQTSKNKVFKKS